jgi:hypothetical protein
MAPPPRRYQDLGRSAVHGLRDEAAKLLRLPRVGLHLCVGKISLQSQDVSFGQLACQRAASVGVFLCELKRSPLYLTLAIEPLETSVSMGSKPFATWVDTA